MDINAKFESISRTDRPALPVAAYDEIKSMAGMDVQGELLKQYNSAKRLYTAAEYDTGVPLNQKAQTLNTISAILGSITKSQTELYNSERLKVMEAVLIDVLKNFPEVQEAFMQRYEERLNAQ